MTGSSQATAEDDQPIEGGLKCVPVTEERLEEVLDHLRMSFFADEPLNQAVGLCKRGERHVELERHCRHTLEQGYSCMIVDENNKV